MGLVIDEKPQRKRRFRLDQPILCVSPSGDMLRLRDFLRSIALGGSSGGGKSTIMGIVLQAALESHHTAYIACAKSDTADWARNIAVRAGREDDVVVVDGSGQWRFNPIDYALKNAGDAWSIDEALDEVWTMVEILNRGDVTRQGDAFFEPACKQCTRYVMTVLWLAYGKIELRRFLSTVQTLPAGFGALEESPERSEIVKHLSEARKRFAPGESLELDLAEDYFLKEIPNLSDKTRSSIQISTTVKVAGLFQRGIFPVLFEKESNISPDDVLTGGKILIWNFPMSKYRAIGRAVGVGFKQALQKAGLRRLETHQGPEEELAPCGIWCDESQAWLTDFDSEACERGRSSRLYHVYSYQSNSSLARGFGGGEQGIGKTDDLLANLNIRIMCSQTDAKTRKASSETIGMEEVWVATEGSNLGTGQSGGGKSGGWSVNSGQSESFTIQDKPALPEQAFMGLKNGEDGVVEAYLFKGGAEFKHNGKRFLRVRFLADHMKPGKVFPLYPKVPLSIWFDKTPTARSWAFHIPLWKVVCDCLRSPRNTKRNWIRWIAFWGDVREILLEEESND